MISEAKRLVLDGNCNTRPIPKSSLSTEKQSLLPHSDYLRVRAKLSLRSLDSFLVDSSAKSTEYIGNIDEYKKEQLATKANNFVDGLDTNSLKKIITEDWNNDTIKDHCLLAMSAAYSGYNNGNLKDALNWYYGYLVDSGIEVIESIQDFIGYDRDDYNSKAVSSSFLESMITYPSSYIGYCLGSPWSPGGKALWFENKIVSSDYIDGGFTIYPDKGYIDIMLQFSGQYFEGKSNYEFWELLRVLKVVYDAKCTRIDLAIDDYTNSRIPVEQMVNATSEGNNFGFKSFKFIASGKATIGLQDLSQTIYFGSRESAKMVRVYNHVFGEDEHGNIDQALRFETEFKKHYAPAIFEVLASLDPKMCTDYPYRSLATQENRYKAMCFWLDSIRKYANIIDVEKLYEVLHGCNDSFEILVGKIMSALAVESIDFRDKSSRKDRSKASRKDTKRLSFYQDFIDLIGIEIGLRVPRKKSSIQTTVAWMQRQVSKSLYIIKSGLGLTDYRMFMQGLLNTGSNKMRIADHKLVAFIRDNRSVVLAT